MAEAQSATGNIILWGTNDTSDVSNNWITYASETTPLLQAFMSDISIEREYDYNGEYNNLKSEDVKNLYGGAFFKYSSGDGKNVLSSTMTNSDVAFISGTSKVQATDSNGDQLYYQTDGSISTTISDNPAYWLYEREIVNGIERSIYTYDTSNLWSPQHGYLTSAKAQVTINPVELEVALSGTKIYGQDVVIGASTATDAGTIYNTGYEITYDGLVGDETVEEVLEGTIKYNGNAQSDIVYESDANDKGAGTYSFDGSKFDTTSLTADNNNYTISYSGELTISKADLYIDVDGTRVYGTENNTASYTYSASEGTDDNLNDGTLKSWDSTNSFDLTGLDGWSHEEINNLESSTSVTHNGDVTGNTIEYNTDVKGTSSNPEAYDLSNTSDLGNGSSSNYNIIFDTENGSEGNFTITPTTLEYDVIGERTYGDANSTATGSVTANNLITGDSQDDVLDVDSEIAIAQWMAEEKYSLTETKNAGEYTDETLTASEASNQGILIKEGNENYVLADTADSFKFTINKAKLVFDVNDQTKIYGEYNPTLTGDNGTGWKNSESLTNVNDDGTYSNSDISMGYSTSANQQSDVGTYKVRVSNSTKTNTNSTTLNENYNITYKNGDLEITKADLDFSATGSSKYGTVPDIDDLTLTATNGAYTTAAESTNNTEGKLKSWDAGSASDITTLTGFSSENPITLIDTNGNEIGVLTSVVRDTDGSVLSYGLADGSFKDVNGDMQVSTKNYNLNFNGTDSTFTVIPKELQFAIDSATKVYGDDNPAFEGDNGTGWINGDSLASINNNGEDEDINLTIDYGTTANEKSNAGEYNINITNQETISDTLSNYDITYGTNELTINKAQLDFVVEGQSKTYGDENAALTGQFDASDFKNGDSITVDAITGAVTNVSLNDNGTSTDTDTNIGLTYSANGIDEKSNAGTYDDVLTASGVNLENYKVVYTAGDMKIAKAQLDFVVDNASKTYGDANPTFTGSFDTSTNDFKNGDSITVNSTGAVTNISLNDNGSTVTDTNSSQVSGFDYETDATQYSEANGDYYIKADGFDLTNYKVNYTVGDLDIDKASLTYTVNDLTKEYGEDPTYTGIYTGLKGDNDTNTLGSIDPSITGADQQSDVGEYDLTATFDEDVISDDFRNYELTTKSGKLTVTPADLYFNAEGERDYGVDSSVDDFTYSASKGVSDTEDGALKSWDSSSEDDLATLEGFNKNGTDDLILYTEVDGERTQIGTVTNVQFDSNNNVVGYTLADGSFTRADGSNQLGSLYNWIFEGGSYTINELPIPGENDYQDNISLANSMGGFREPNDIASILYLNVVDNAINVNLGELKRFDDFKNLVNAENSESFDDLEISK